MPRASSETLGKLSVKLESDIWRKESKNEAYRTTNARQTKVQASTTKLMFPDMQQTLPKCR
jgi:hypothetical protein